KREFLLPRKPSLLRTNTWRSSFSGTPCSMGAPPRTMGRQILDHSPSPMAVVLIGTVSLISPRLISGRQETAQRRTGSVHTRWVESGGKQLEQPPERVVHRLQTRRHALLQARLPGLADIDLVEWLEPHVGALVVMHQDGRKIDGKDF